MRCEDYPGLSQWVLNPVTMVLRHTEKTDMREGDVKTGRDWSDVATKQAGQKPPAARKYKQICPLEAL